MLARHSVPALPAGCEQTPALQASAVQISPSSVQGVPLATSFVRHTPDPLQVSGAVHSVLALEPQEVPAGCLASFGHVAPLPVQCSETSHSPVEARHSVEEGSNASVGHVVLEPVQVSCTSQTPADGRQTAPACPAGCWHALLAPSH